MTRSPRTGPLLRWTRIVLLLLIAAYAPVGAADDQSDRRVLIGLKLFPTLIAADLDLDEKRAADGRLHLVVLYRENREFAKEALGRLSTVENIRGLSVRVSIQPYARLAQLEQDPPAALFLTEWSPDDLAGVVQFGITHQRLVFSPFKGDVSKGAAAGIFVSDRILPLVNRDTLGAAGIGLKPFLMEVAKTDE